jgi:hypothetical protein
LEELDMDGRVILQCNLKARCEGLDWFNLVQDMAKLRDLAKNNTSFLLSGNRGIFISN